MGSATTRQTIASTKNAVRQPIPTMSPLTIGERMAPPKPEPESAMEMAKPRLAVNQFAVMRLISRRVEATAKQPATAKRA